MVHMGFLWVAIASLHPMEVADGRSSDGFHHWTEIPQIVAEERVPSGLRRLAKKNRTVLRPATIWR